MRALSPLDLYRIHLFGYIVTAMAFALMDRCRRGDPRRRGDGGSEMVFTDNLEYYMPLFHLNALWLFALGLAVLNSL